MSTIIEPLQTHSGSVDADVQDYPSARAKARGIDVDPLVNVLLKKDIELIKAAR
jgi:hypothetical protein